MTDKQIIIDGCDVQNCEFFNYCDTDVEFSECLAHWHPNEDYSNVYYASCDAYPNCYYKQLKRSEAQCEAMFVSYTDLEKKYKAKEQECEELKDKLIKWLGKEGLRQSEKEFYEQQLDQLKAENEELKGIRDRNFLHALEEQQRADKLSKTLTEIKEIAEKIDDSGGCAYGDYDCDNCSSLEQETVCTYKVKKLILQKISEGEGNDE